MTLPFSALGATVRGVVRQSRIAPPLTLSTAMTLSVALTPSFTLVANASAQTTPTDAVLAAFDDHRVVAVGENHGHADFHLWVLDLLEDPRSVDRIDDVAVEWGNALYQGVVDRYLDGEDVPWDSVTMAWRNTVVSPNTVWDAPVYADFFRGVRQINAGLAPSARYRVLLTDAPVDWSQVDSRDDLTPFYDRAAAMAEVVRRASLLEGRRSLFLAGGLHVSKHPRVRPNRLGVPVGEITPVAWWELRHPGATWVIQSFARDGQLAGLPDAVARGPSAQSADARVFDTSAPPLSTVAAGAVTTLRNRDGSVGEVYGDLLLSEIVDAIIVWPETSRTFVEPTPEAFRDEWYWDALNRRSRMLFDRPMDPQLRGEVGGSG